MHVIFSKNDAIFYKIIQDNVLVNINKMQELKSTIKKFITVI